MEWRANARGRFYGYAEGRKHWRNRWTWEQANGPIPDGWEVHHINRDCGDDRIENLVALPSEDHAAIHRSEPRTLVCGNCQDEFEHAGRGKPPSRCPDCTVLRKREGYRRADARRRVTRNCLQCGTEFTTRAGRLCSPACINRWRTGNRL